MNKKQTVLFLNRSFYDYDAVIKSRLIEREYDVIDFSIVPKLSNWQLLVNTLSKNKVKQREVKKCQQNIIDQIKKINKTIDVVFLLSGQEILNDFLEQLKSLYPKARFIWYLWDNTSAVAEFESAKQYFDTVISFDIKESEEKGLVYSPLFYSKEKKTEKIYDLCFIGSAHSNRINIVDSIVRTKLFKNTFIHIYATKIDYVKLLFKNVRKLFKYVRLSKISLTESMDRMAKSKYVLDISFPSQTGLSMRTFEALGCHSKLITTNSNIVDYDFYSPDNIFILNENNVEALNSIDIDSPFKKPDAAVFNYYSLDSWIDRLIKFF